MIDQLGYGPSNRSSSLSNQISSSSRLAVSVLLLVIVYHSKLNTTQIEAIGVSASKNAYIHRFHLRVYSLLIFGCRDGLGLDLDEARSVVYSTILWLLRGRIGKGMYTNSCACLMFDV